MAPEHKVVLIGSTAVGKTSIINQFMYNTANPDHQPTIGIDFFSKHVKKGDISARMQIWDTAGQEKFQALIPSYIRNSTVAVLVFAINDLDTFTDLKKWHQKVLEVASPILMVVGNKVDLEADRVVTAESAEEYAGSINAKYIETSARVPINIDDLFIQIAQIPLP
jgi:Ras-related protein Rab-6A